MINLAGEEMNWIVGLPFLCAVLIVIASPFILLNMYVTADVCNQACEMKLEDLE